MRQALPFFVALLLLPGCREGANGPAPPSRPVPTVPATVLTLEVSSHPPTRAFRHRIAVAGGKARIGSELDRWRLFDFEAGTITWVDDVTKTYRTLTLADAVRARQRQLRTAPPTGTERVTMRQTGLTREFDGKSAQQWVAELGDYHREIWITDEPLVHPSFLRMWMATEPVADPFAGVSARVMGTLMDLEGFPVYDRAVLKLDEGGWTSRSRLVEVESRPVPASWLAIPEDYEDVTPPALRSAGDRRSAS